MQIQLIPDSKIRSPAVAGQFYPDWPDDLRGMIEDFLEKAPAPQGAAPKAIIVPHAAYAYSGPIAASAYGLFRTDQDIIKRIILVGPSHYIPFRGIALTGAEAFATPLGAVPIDTDVAASLVLLPQAKVLETAHAQEHCLEVQLPFLQVLLQDFKIAPLLTGDANAEEVCQVIERLWGGPETRFVITSDLSQDRDYLSAQRLDRATARSIERGHSEKIGPPQACGYVAVRGMMAAARLNHLCSRTIDLRNSGDTVGPRDVVVGYGAFAFGQS
jgi:AmmeMemoRadiSam system protein B